MAQENTPLLGLAESSAQGGSPCAKSREHLREEQRAESPGMVM